MTLDIQEKTTKAELIAAQNDRFRKSWGGDVEISGRLMLTAGVAVLPFQAQMDVMTAVMTFDTFTEDNDPHGEHDFGAFEITSEGETHLMFWKIDLYDRAFYYGSEARDDLIQTRRVLTIMLRSEY
jgi:hypothetical protein